MPPPRRSWTSTAGAWLLAALVVAAPLARGGVDLPVQLAAAALAGLALLLLTGGGERSRAERSRAEGAPEVTAPRVAGARTAPVAVPRLLVPLLLVLAWSALQALPLAGGVAISLDAPASGWALASAAAGLLGFAAGSAVAGTSRRRDVVVAGLGLAGVAVAVAALGAALLRLGPLLAPAFPFVNSNHQSGLLLLGAFVLLGLGLRRRGSARLLWLLGFVLAVAALFFTLSRGGIGAFFGGVALFLALATRRQLNLPGDQPLHPWRRYATAGLLAALGVVAWLALEPVVRELATLRTARDDLKLELWRPGVRLLGQHPWLGIGRGSFATAFAALKDFPGQVTFTHLENEWLQPLIDLGVPAGLLLVGTLGVAWLLAARRRDLSMVEVGLLAGTAAVAAQNLVDFSLEFTGVGLPFMVALGVIGRGDGGRVNGGGGGGGGGGGDGGGGGGGGGAPWLRLPRAWLAGGVVAVLGVAAAGAIFWRAHPTGDEADAVARAPTAAAAALLAEEALRWHRADYLPAATAGARWVLEGRCAPAMPWLTRAMALDPTAPEPHQFAARCLAAAGQHPLARREYRLAMLYGSPTALSEAAERYPPVEELLQVAADTGDGLLALGQLLLSRQRPADAARVFRLALERSLDARALAPLAGALLSAGELEEALELARRRTREAPSDPHGWSLVAAALQAEGYDGEAGAALEQGLALNPGSPPLVEALVYRSLAARRTAEARRLAESMLVRSPAELASRQLLVAATLAAQGRLNEAVERARSAAAALPDAPGPLLTVAAYCEQAGRLDDAIAAVERAASLPGQRRQDHQPRLDGLQQARAAQVQRRMTEELLKPSR